MIARRWLALLALLLGLAALQGCASLPWRAPALENTGPTTERADPWERFNRRIFAFNEAIDGAIIKPLALGYRAVVPEWLRTGIDNMFGNIGDAWSAVNLVLQAKPRAALEMGMRVATNTVFGVLGFVDVADELGLERRQVEDFGQTLGRWGIKSGPYLVLPLLGPSTLRDAAALTVDFKASPPNLAFRETRDQNAGTGLQLLNTRVKLLNASRVLDDIALDKYILLRDAYLARRRSLIYDGNPPDEDEPAASTAGTPVAPVPAAASAPGGE
ncbi:VacJ family lipoprotein [Aquabacterium sp.]|uniref:MlaA family lipoprotein n=1 Tax=Aquabacterium sp. TaxID=1872578 RepID=UPI003784B7BB